VADKTPEPNAEETNAEETPEVTADETPEAEEPGTEAAETSVEPEAQTGDPAEVEAPSEEPPVAEQPEAETPAAEPEAPKRKKKRLPRSERHKHSKPAREKPAKRKPITRTPKPETSPAARQERRGVVVSDKGEKTIVVSVDVTKLHPKYKKVVRRTRKFHAHDEENTAGIGDVVRIVESRRISKTKNWRLAEVVEKAK
jgi:small subunit ribosomal protein S17